MTQPRYDIELRGCAPTPLAYYLKALGILRLVAEQADPGAKGWWEYDTFWLRSTLDETGLVEFFLETYSPTPLVGPWGARSGFFSTGTKGDSEGAARNALDSIIACTQPRMQTFRRAIVETESVLSRTGFSTKPEKGDDNFRCMLTCRNELPDDVLAWVDAALVLLESEAKCPPLLGTGGNEGSGSYMSGFAQTVVAVTVNRLWDHAIAPCLYEDLSASTGSDQTPGHFSPFATGGKNGSGGFEADTVMNPWDYLLCIEGSVVFAASAVKKLESGSRIAPAYPFSVEASGLGHASSALSDESSKRSEIWLPLWNRPTTQREIDHVFSEGRAILKGKHVATATDFARSISSLGVDRGISSFQRIGFQLRNGDRSNFAIGISRYDVRLRPPVDLVNDLDKASWLIEFRKVASNDKSPPSMKKPLRELETAIFDLTKTTEDRTDQDSSLVQQLLIEIGCANHVIGKSKSLREGNRSKKLPALSPVPLLSPEWLLRANDGSVEFRLAAALASMTHDTIGPLRRHLEPIDVARLTAKKNPSAKWAKEDGDPAIVWGGGILVRNLNAVLSRRFIEAMKSGDKELFAPFKGRCFASLGDVAQFIQQTVDDRKIEALLRGLMLLDWQKVSREHVAELRGAGRPLPHAAYALLKLCHLPHALEDKAIKLSPQITRRALAGDAVGATQLAARRLLASGFPPAVQQVNCPREQILRTCAAVLFPISRTSESKLAEVILAKHKRPEPDPESKLDSLSAT